MCLDAVKETFSPKSLLIILNNIGHGITPHNLDRAPESIFALPWVE